MHGDLNKNHANTHRYGSSSRGVGGRVGAMSGLSLSLSPSPPALPSGVQIQMPVLRAPRSVFDNAAHGAGAGVDGGGSGISSSVSAPAMLVLPNWSGFGSGMKRPAKSLLRSVLKNLSRTPSPLPPPVPTLPSQEIPVAEDGEESERVRVREGEGEGDDEDGGSASSYDSGRETIFDVLEDQ